MRIKRKINFRPELSEDDALELAQFYINKKYGFIHTKKMGNEVLLRNLTGPVMDPFDMEAKQMYHFRKGKFSICTINGSGFGYLEFSPLWVYVLVLLGFFPLVLGIFVSPWFFIGSGAAWMIAGFIFFEEAGTALQLLEDAQRSLQLGREYMMEEIRKKNANGLKEI